VERQYHALPIRELGAHAGFRRPTQAQAARVTPESPALEAMTDLAHASPATIRPQAPLAGANEFMITRGVRLLIVVDEEHEEVLGVITAADILALAEVERARVGHVLETLRLAGRQHLLVTDAQSMVRGIFSVSQIARQLGVTLPAGSEVARTFSEIEAALAK